MFVPAIHPRAAAEFAMDLQAMVASHGPTSGTFASLSLLSLASQARRAAAPTVKLERRFEIAREAALFSRQYAQIAGPRCAALAVWYRALALVMFGAARWRP